MKEKKQFTDLTIEELEIQAKFFNINIKNNDRTEILNKLIWYKVNKNILITFFRKETTIEIERENIKKLEKENIKEKIRKEQERECLIKNYRGWIDNEFIDIENKIYIEKIIEKYWISEKDKKNIYEIIEDIFCDWTYNC